VPAGTIPSPTPTGSGWEPAAGGRYANTGIRKMLIRRAEQAGYVGVTPHQFRHTFSDAWLKSGGSEGDLMRLNGWKSRQMVDRYADDVANQRALDAKRRMGDKV
jgi:integrase